MRAECSQELQEAVRVQLLPRRGHGPGRYSLQVYCFLEVDSIRLNVVLVNAVINIVVWPITGFHIGVVLVVGGSSAARTPG